MKFLVFRLAVVVVFSVACLTLPSSAVRAGTGGVPICSSAFDCSMSAAASCPYGVRAYCCCFGSCAADCSNTSTNNCGNPNCPQSEN